MNALLLKRFLRNPRQVAYLVPSSSWLRRRVLSYMDLSVPRVVVEFGPGEGCHSREILARMAPGSRLILLELDPVLAEHLKEQFAHHDSVHVFHRNAAQLPEVLAQLGLPHCDYVVSGIPFSLLPVSSKREILAVTHAALRPGGDSALITYQVSRELWEQGFCDHFLRSSHSYCLLNFPPMWVSCYYRAGIPLNEPARWVCPPSFAMP